MTDFGTRKHRICDRGHCHPEDEPFVRCRCGVVLCSDDDNRLCRGCLGALKLNNPCAAMVRDPTVMEREIVALRRQNQLWMIWCAELQKTLRENRILAAVPVELTSA